MLALLSVWAAASWDKIWYLNENKEEQDKYCGDCRPKRGGYHFTGRQNIRGAPWKGSSGNSKRNVNLLAASLLQFGAIGAQFSSSRAADWADLWKVVRNPVRGFDSIQRWQTPRRLPPRTIPDRLRYRVQMFLQVKYNFVWFVVKHTHTVKIFKFLLD